MINKLIKMLVNWKFKRDCFWTWSWSVDEHVDIHIISEESYFDRHRFGMRFEDNRAVGFPVKRCEFKRFDGVDDNDFCSRGEEKANERI